MRLLVILGVLLLPGCGGSSHSGATAVTKTDDVRTAYDASVAGLDRQYFDDMSMSSPTQMRQVLLLPDHGTGQMVAEWEGALAAGAAQARLRLPSRLSYVEVFEHRDGQALPLEAAYGYSLQRHDIPSSGDTDAQRVAAAELVLRDFGLTPTSIRVLHPLGPALFVEARTDDPALVDGRMGELETALEGSRSSGLDGMYVAVDGPDGPLFRGEGAARIAEGGQWFADGFDSGIPHG